MSVKLPDIDWDCRLTCRDLKGMDRIIATTVRAMTTDTAYALCEKMARSCNYTIIASTITPANRAACAQPAVPWSGGSQTASAPPKEDAFPGKFFTKTSARPTIKYAAWLQEGS